MDEVRAFWAREGLPAPPVPAAAAPQREREPALAG